MLSGARPSGSAIPRVELRVNSSSTWAPFPDVLPAFVVPKWFGSFVLHSHGGVAVEVETVPMDVVVLEGALTMLDLRGKVSYFSLPTVSPPPSPPKPYAPPPLPLDAYAGRRWQKKKKKGWLLITSDNRP